MLLDFFVNFVYYTIKLLLKYIKQKDKYAGMAELADVQDLGSCAERRVGSTPTTRTRKRFIFVVFGNDLFVVCLRLHIVDIFGMLKGGINDD